MSKTGIFIFLFLFPVSLLKGQQDSCRLKLYSVQAEIGKCKTRSSNLNAEQQQAVAPASTLLQREMIIPQGFPSNSSMLVRSLACFAQAQFLPYNRKKQQYSKRCIIGLGLRYEKSRSNGNSYFHETTPGRYDTLAFISYDLFGAPHNDTIFHDTLWYSYRYFSMKQMIVCGEFNATIHTDDQKQFSCGVGAGMLLGIVSSSASVFYQSSQQYISLYKPDYSSTPTQSSISPSGIFQPEELEDIKLRPVFFLRVNTPLCFQFRLSKRPCFFNRLTLTGQIYAGCQLNIIPGLSPSLKFNKGVSCGLKYYLHPSHK